MGPRVGRSVSLRPGCSDLSFPGEGNAETEEVGDCLDLLHEDIGDSHGDVGADCELDLVMNPAERYPLPVPALRAEAFSEGSVEVDDPVLADDRPSGLQERVESGSILVAAFKATPNGTSQRPKRVLSR